jgi:hypothetical protein
MDVGLDCPNNLRHLLLLHFTRKGPANDKEASQEHHPCGADRNGLVERRGRLRRRAQGTSISLGQKPNELWCTDYKGEFLMGNHQYCYPLTVTDHASRYLLTGEALSATKED